MKSNWPLAVFLVGVGSGALLHYLRWRLTSGILLLAMAAWVDVGLLNAGTSDVCGYSGNWYCNSAVQAVASVGFWALIGGILLLLGLGAARFARRFARPA